MTQHFYLDHAASAPLRPEARSAMEHAFDTPGNASSPHAFGRAARALLEEGRASVAELVGAHPEDVVFTSGGTESINTVFAAEPWQQVFLSPLEHPAVMRSAQATGAQLHILPLDEHGVVRPDVLEAGLKNVQGQKTLVSLAGAHSETGLIQPVAEAARLAHHYGALCHCDGVQYAGKTMVNMADLNVDFLSLSAHKMGGPQGIGALVLKKGQELSPYIKGGAQENRRRAGTPPVAGAAGFGAAALASLRDLKEGKADIYAAWRASVEKELLAVEPGLVILGHTAQRVSPILCFSTPGWPGQEQLMAMDLEGIAVSAGLACSSGKSAPPASLKAIITAMGREEDLASCALRVSFGWFNGDGDGDAFVKAWTKAYTRRSARAA